MKSYKDLRLELAGALLAFVAGVVGAVLDRFGVPFQTYLPVIVGLLITATVSLLKVELMARIDRDSRIQRLLDQLEHEDLLVNSLKG
jgi:hypothetical protein